MVICSLAFLPTGWGLILVRLNILVPLPSHSLPDFLLSFDCNLGLVCSNCEAKNRAHLAVGLHQGSSQIIRLRYGRCYFCSRSYSSMASKYIRLPNPFPLQRGVQQALAYPNNYCWDTEAQVDNLSKCLCSVHFVVIQW